MAGKKILVADDDAIFVKLVQRDLIAAGYDVIMAKNGREAVDMAKSHMPALVLMDVNMPVMDGGDAGRVLKADAVTKAIPVVYLTSLMSESEVAALGHVIAGNYFMAKPYDPKKLLEEVKKRV